MEATVTSIRQSRDGAGNQVRELSWADVDPTEPLLGAPSSGPATTTRKNSQHPATPDGWPRR